MNLLDKNDGKVLGFAFNRQRGIERKKESFISRLKGEHVERCVTVVVKENKALRELCELHPWFPSLMKGMLNNHLVMTGPSVNSKMLNLSNIEANTIGRKTAKILREKAIPDFSKSDARNEGDDMFHKSLAILEALCILDSSLSLPV